MVHPWCRGELIAVVGGLSLTYMLLLLLRGCGFVADVRVSDNGDSSSGTFSSAVAVSCLLFLWFGGEGGGIG